MMTVEKCAFILPAPYEQTLVHYHHLRPNNVNEVDKFKPLNNETVIRM